MRESKGKLEDPKKRRNLKMIWTYGAKIMEDIRHDFFSGVLALK